MQDKTPRDRRAPYTGRFASPDGGRPRGDAPIPARSASARRDAAAPTRAGGSAPDRRRDGDATRRPSGFAAPPAAERRPAATRASEADAGKRAKQPGPLARLTRRKEKPESGKRIRNKRSQAVRMSWWEKLLIAVAALALAVLLLALIFGGGGGTYHQMPRIERGGDSAYAPEESAQTGDGEASGEIDWSQYLVTPTPGAAAAAQTGDGEASGETDWSQYLVTPTPGAAEPPSEAEGSAVEMPSGAEDPEAELAAELEGADVEIDDPAALEAALEAGA